MLAGFDVARTGVASVGFIGFPSVGKSTLLTKLTGTHSEAAAYEFTTLTTVPGQVLYNGAKIQMLDLPGIIQGAKDGKGRGRQVIAVAKTCNLIFIVLDVNKPLTDKRVIETELEGFGVRINKSPPNIVFKKKDKGGLNITNTVPLSHVDHEVSSQAVSFPSWLFLYVYAGLSCRADLCRSVGFFQIRRGDGREKRRPRKS